MACAAVCYICSHCVMELCNVLQATLMDATRGCVNKLGDWEGEIARGRNCLGLATVLL